MGLYVGPHDDETFCKPTTMKRFILVFRRRGYVLPSWVQKKPVGVCVGPHDDKTFCTCQKGSPVSLMPPEVVPRGNPVCGLVGAKRGMQFFLSPRRGNIFCTGEWILDTPTTIDVVGIFRKWFVNGSSSCVSYKPTTVKRSYSLKTFRRRGCTKRFVVPG